MTNGIHTCLGCSCLCDDISWPDDRETSLPADFTCDIGRAWFQARLGPTNQTQSCLVHGQSATLESALQSARKLLDQSTYPLVYGLSQSTNETARAATALADTLGAVLDVALSPLERARIMALQEVGSSTATFGFVRNHATQVIYLGCDPDVTHPRLRERYLPANVTPIVIGSQRRHPDRRESTSIVIRPGSWYDVVGTLRSLAQSQPAAAERFAVRTGVSLNTWKQLHEQVVQADLTAVFYSDDDLGASDAEAAAWCEALARWAEELRNHAQHPTRLVIMPLGHAGNPTGVTDVLTWQTGFPFAIDFSAGYPQFDPLKYSAEQLLATRQVDAVLLIEPAESLRLSATAIECIRDVPTILISHRLDWGPLEPSIGIPASVMGVESTGIVHRGDHIALPLRPIRSGVHIAASSILARLLSDS